MRIANGASASRGAVPGFTLLELLIGLSIGAIILTAATSAFSFAVKEQRAQRLRLQLARDGSGLNQVLTQELRLAGLGRPRGQRVPGVGDYPASILVSQGASLGIVADLPRPDASYSTLGVLHDRPAGVNHVMWHTENNGNCAPDLSGASCDTASSSLMFPGESGCSSTGSATDRVCPWGSKRLRPGDRFQIVSGDGSFIRVRAPVPFTLDEAMGADANNLLAFRVDGSTPFPVEWPNTVRADAPVDIRGQGWVTTMDRAFYRHNPKDNTFERRQCWGEFNIDHASWPARWQSTNASTLAPGSSFDPAAVPNTECTPWEVLAYDVESARFEYRNADGDSLGFPDRYELWRIARIDWTIRLARVIDKQRIHHDVVGTANIRNY